MRERTVSCCPLALLLFSLESVLGIGVPESTRCTTAGDYDDRFDPLADRLSQNDGLYQVEGPSGFTFPNPDFTVGEMRSTLVFRWQYQPGSTLYLVWNRNQSQTRRNAHFEPLRDLGSVFGDGRNTLGVKLTYWLGL